MKNKDKDSGLGRELRRLVKGFPFYEVTRVNRDPEFGIDLGNDSYFVGANEEEEDEDNPVDPTRSLLFVSRIDGVYAYLVDDSPGAGETEKVAEFTSAIDPALRRFLETNLIKD